MYLALWTTDSSITTLKGSNVSNTSTNIYTDTNNNTAINEYTNDSEWLQQQLSYNHERQVFEEGSTETDTSFWEEQAIEIDSHHH